MVMAYVWKGNHGPGSK